MSICNENECTVDGVDYITAESTVFCIGCAGADPLDDELCLALGECRKWARDDGRNKIWVKK